jgi:hypothetical protein
MRNYGDLRIARILSNCGSDMAAVAKTLRDAGSGLRDTRPDLSELRDALGITRRTLLLVEEALAELEVYQ